MKLFALTALLLAVAAGVYFMGSMTHYLIVYLTAWIILLPVALSMAIWVFSSFKRTGSISARLKKAVLVTIIGSIALFTSLVVGMHAGRYYVRQAWAYVDAVVPALDAYKKKHGKYPASLSDADLQVPSPPRLLSSKNGYSSNGDRFGFTYPSPSGWSGDGFNSESRRWKFLDD